MAAARGESAWVVGDGVSTVVALVDSQLNTDPRRGTGEDAPLNRIDLSDNPEVTLELQRAGLRADSVPAPGQKVLIQRNGNVAWDVTDQMHPSGAATAALAARVVGLDIAGIDMVLEDISANPCKSPARRRDRGQRQPRPAVPHQTRQWRRAPVGQAPSWSTCSTPRRWPHSRHRHHRHPKHRAPGSPDGLAGPHQRPPCGSGLQRRPVPGRPPRAVATDAAHWEPSQRLLINRSVQAAVFENSNRMILGEGLAYDRCAVGVVTDIGWSADLADFDILDAEQTFKVVRTQVDVILPSGTAVLNASDAAGGGAGRLVRWQGDFLRPGCHPPHAGGTPRRRRARWYTCATARSCWPMPPKKLPWCHLTALKPAKAAQPEMVMAAVAAAWALNIPVELIAAGLRTFESTPQENSLLNSPCKSPASAPCAAPTCGATTRPSRPWWNAAHLSEASVGFDRWF